MKFYSRKWVKPEDLNAYNTLFGGKILSWIDEEAAIYAKCQLKSKNVVTKYISEIVFINSSKHGDVVEIGLETIDFGTTSITMSCMMRNKFTKEEIVTIEKIVFVLLDEDGVPLPHGKSMPITTDSSIGSPMT